MSSVDGCCFFDVVGALVLGAAEEVCAALVVGALLVVAIGSGSIGLNYVNHAGFWLVKESFGMTLGQATRSHTAIQTIVSVCGLGMTLLLSLVL